MSTLSKTKMLNICDKSMVFFMRLFEVYFTHCQAIISVKFSIKSPDLLNHDSKAI